MLDGPVVSIQTQGNRKLTQPLRPLVLVRLCGLSKLDPPSDREQRIEGMLQRSTACAEFRDIEANSVTGQLGSLVQLAMSLPRELCATASSEIVE